MSNNSKNSFQEQFRTFATNVANAIRARGGTTAQIVASDFPTAIANIPSPSLKKPIKFYDYDGTLLGSYTHAEFANFTDYPLPTPSHDDKGLTFVKWNWTVAEIKSHAKVPINVGAVYTTSDNKIHVHVSLNDKLPTGKTVEFISGTIQGETVDWGDGTVDTNTSHTYSDYGDYVIKVTAYTNSSLANGQLDELFYTDITQRNLFCTAIYLPFNIEKITATFFCYYSLKTLVLPPYVNLFPTSSSMFRYSALNILIIPNTTINRISFNNMYKLNAICLPYTLRGFNYCYLKDLGCANVFNINAYYDIAAFSFIGLDCSPIVFDFSNAISVPTLVGSNSLGYKTNTAEQSDYPPAINGINHLTKIVVPDSLYSSWISATNWAYYADYIYKASEVNFD